VTSIYPNYAKIEFSYQDVYVNNIAREYNNSSKEKQLFLCTEILKINVIFRLRNVKTDIRKAILMQ
jgi:hypothetical protein